MSTTALDLDQIRADVAIAAERNHRRNRPTKFVILAIALAAVSLVALLLMIQRRSDAITALAKEKSIGEKTVELVAQLREIKAAEEATSVRYGNEIELTLSKFANPATAAGLKNFPKVPPRPVKDKEMNGVVRSRLTYEVRDDSMQNLMKWVQLVIQDVPGLEVYSINLKPEATQWMLKITFCRWERTEPKK